jgi:hypothetical protein
VQFLAIALWLEDDWLGERLDGEIGLVVIGSQLRYGEGGYGNRGKGEIEQWLGNLFDRTA